MTTFFDTPDLLPAFVAGNFSRVVGAGVDPFEYGRVTAGLESLYDWPAALSRTGCAHLAAGERAEAAGNTLSAAASYRTAAAWLHCATVMPHPDREAFVQAEAAADQAMRRSLALLEPEAVRIEGPGFVGWLRRPAGAARPPIAVIVPGMDSSKEEFHDVADALLGRGLAVASIDGPGQGLLAASSAPEPDYDKVVGAVLDVLARYPELDHDRTAVIGLSMGGFYAAVAAAREPRVRAAAAVSGPSTLDWQQLPAFVIETLTQRCGSEDSAREFARRLDLTPLAGTIAVPLLVVDGGMDRIPGVANGASLAEAAPYGEYLLVPHGDHLLGNARADWLPATADWLAERAQDRRHH
ncbi:dipeptidyl aminopeptidase/acylaminoacyl peptidase [Kitasatospora sp. MAP12-15]|uniref:alpha/beta hydrolase family protein n=1 Tax=unclassified Kitasatospora TaxID=2633591 RepID=UPI002474D018|nr:alpha/beta fold hydrolase [Kitasatospora sp. MAP12-44]MDH6111605.1 dipeptidyl aminopeptidase/acylaminoacyl peptidase [Kitasatospora sp. MAP12-44]